MDPMRYVLLEFMIWQRSKDQRILPSGGINAKIDIPAQNLGSQIIKLVTLSKSF